MLNEYNIHMASPCCVRTRREVVVFDDSDHWVEDAYYLTVEKCLAAFNLYTHRRVLTIRTAVANNLYGVSDIRGTLLVVSA